LNRIECITLIGAAESEAFGVGGLQMEIVSRSQPRLGDALYRLAKASRVRTRYAHPTHEPKHYDDDQNEPQNAAEPANPIATVRIVPTAAAENNK
jgi:hypothetical protein